jgi:hypothetical protein
VTSPRIFEHCWPVIAASTVVAAPLAIHEGPGSEKSQKGSLSCGHRQNSGGGRALRGRGQGGSDGTKRRGWEHGAECFLVTFFAPKKHGVGLQPAYLLKQKGGTWGDDFSSLRYLLLHAQPESHSREKVGHMKSEGLVCPTNADCPPKGLLGLLKEWVRSALAFLNPS